MAYLVLIYLSLPKEKQFCGEQPEAHWKNTHFYRHPYIFLIKTEDIFKEKKNHILSLLLKRNEEDKVPSIHCWSSNFYHIIGFY